MLEGTTDNGTASETPASSGVASTGNISSGTASEAMIKAASAASSADTAPAGTAGDTTTTAGAAPTGTTAPATEGTVASGQPASAAGARGPIPFDRHEAALKNARLEAAAEAVKPLAWAKDFNPQHVQAGMGLLRELNADPRAFYKRLGAELDAQNPQQTQTATEEDEKFPDPDVQNQDGSLKTYSDKTLQKILDIHTRRVMKQMEGKLKPVLDTHQHQQQMEQENTMRAQVREQGQRVMAEAREMPHFKEHEPAILETLKAMDPQVKRSLGPVASLYRAYNQVLAEKVFPGIDAAAEKRVRDANLKKANTSRGQVNPADGAEGKKPELKNVSDLSKHMERLAAASAS